MQLDVTHQEHMMYLYIIKTLKMIAHAFRWNSSWYVQEAG